jgi:DHA2 family methylenomycin A resistance protein-like MFS transporter
VQKSIFRTTIAASFGFALIQLDVTVVNVALPTFARVLKADVSGLQWVVDAYALSLAALLMSAGYAGDRFGAKRTYLSGLAIFAAASIACGLAADAPMLVLSRIAQGVGAATMLPSSLALINHAAKGHPKARAAAVGWWTAAGAVSIAAGPILGGLLLGNFGWRSIFFVNLPLCLLGILLATKIEETGRLRESRGFDLPGQLFAVVAVGGLTAAVIEARPQGLTPFTFAIAAVGILATAAFILQEKRSKSPMLPLSFFEARTFTCAVGYGAIVNFTYYGIVFILSLYLQRVLDYDPVKAGLAFLPLTATFFVANLISGWWVGRAGSRAPMIIGASIDALGFALLAAVAGSTASYWKLAIAFVLIPLGMGLGVPAMTSAVLAGSSKERAGTASAVLNSARQAAGAMGVALFGAFAGNAPDHIVAGLRISALLAIAMLLGAMLLGRLAASRSPHLSSSR